MRKIHVTAVSLLLALAVVLGLAATTRTVTLGGAASGSSAALVQARTKQLDAYQRSLERQLAQARAARPAARTTAPAQAPVKIVYHRPPPVVVVTHTHYGDDGGSESAREGGGGDD